MEEFKLGDWGESDGIEECEDIIRKAGGTVGARGMILLYEDTDYPVEVFKAIDYLCNEWDYAMKRVPRIKFEMPKRNTPPVPLVVSYRGLGRKAIYPEKSWFGKLFDYLFGCDDIPKFIYKFELKVDISDYLKLGTIVSIEGVRWYVYQVNGPDTYTIRNLYAVEETIFHFSPGTPVFGLYVAVAEK